MPPETPTVISPDPQPPSLTTIPDIPIPPPPSAPNKTFPVIIPVLVGIFILLIISASGVAYLIAVEKISAPTPQIQKSLSDIVFSLPFVPKTPRYVLTKSSAAHQRLQATSFDLSVASSSNSFQSLVGADKLDLHITGYMDYTDPANPLFDISGNLNQDFSLAAKKPDRKVYLKINQIPGLLTAFIGVDSNQLAPLLENWISIDTTPMETEARDLLDSQAPSTSQFNETTVRLIGRITDDSVLPLIKMTSGQSDSVPVYKLEYHPTPEQLDSLINKISASLNPDSSADTPVKVSDYVRDFQLTLLIRQSDYYISQASSTITYLPVSSTSPHLPSLGNVLDSQTPITAALVLKMSDFGLKKPITAPESSLTSEEFFAQIMALSKLGSATPSSSVGVTSSPENSP